MKLEIIEKIKRLFKRGEYALTEGKLTTINDHPKVNIDPGELTRIDTNQKEYQNEYPLIEYINSNGMKRKREYRTLNMRKQTAKLLASLVFNEQCNVTIDDKKQSADAPVNSRVNAHSFIEHVFEHNDFKKKLADYLEPMYALGGITVRPYYDETSGEIEFSWALADAFYPLRSTSNGISEGVMKSTTTDVVKGKVVYYTLLEFHEWNQSEYIITNELYKSDNKSEIGKRVPLADRYDDLEEVTYYENFTKPIFNYCKPSGFNNLSPHSPLGLGIADNSRSVLKSINDTYDEFMWEIKMGQRTVFVNDEMLSAQGHAAINDTYVEPVFDPDVNVYKTVPFPNEAQEPVKDVTQPIRTQEYIEAINYEMQMLEGELGLSMGTISFDGKSVKTATEIVSENSQTFRTRNDHVYEVEKFIKGVVISVLELAAAEGLYDGDIPTHTEITVDFDDGIFQDKRTKYRDYAQLKMQGMIPAVIAMERAFGITRTEAEEWYQMLLKEGSDSAGNTVDASFESMFGRNEL